MACYNKKYAILFVGIILILIFWAGNWFVLILIKVYLDCFCLLERVHFISPLNATFQVYKLHKIAKQTNWSKKQKLNICSLRLEAPLGGKSRAKLLARAAEETTQKQLSRTQLDLKTLICR